MKELLKEYTHGVPEKLDYHWRAVVVFVIAALKTRGSCRAQYLIGDGTVMTSPR